MKRKNILFIILISILSLLIVSVILLSVIRTNYDGNVPAKVNPVEKVISVNTDNQTSGEFYTTSVYCYTNMTVLQYLMVKLTKGSEISKTSTIVDLNSVKNSNSSKIQKDSSIKNAIILAYQEAGCTINYSYEGIIIHTLAVYAPDELNVGDIISSVDGHTFNNENEFMTYYNEARLDEKNYDEVTKEWNIPFIINDEEVIISTSEYAETDNGIRYPIYGFYFYDYYSIDMESLEPTASINNTNTYGPSGGLMQAISVYNMLTEFDYSYGLDIAGTGTIDINGNVGEIGGMYSKIFTAYKNGIDIFFVPYVEGSDGIADNYEDAMRAYHDLGDPQSLTLVPVSTFNDAIDFLKNYNK